LHLGVLRSRTRFDGGKTPTELEPLSRGSPSPENPLLYVGLRSGIYSRLFHSIWLSFVEYIVLAGFWKSLPESGKFRRS
ncbi:hypothetical protein LINGRAHAP2_LOCUS31450, partial [Linum grandiflorum]